MATTVERTQPVTAEDFFALPEVPGKKLELVYGKVVEVSGPGAVHGFVLNAVLMFLNNLAGIGKQAFVLPEVAYILASHPGLVRVPDASVVLREHLPGGSLPSGQWEIAPDLAVEVVSPNDPAPDVQAKIQQYLAAGTQIVWVLWPDTRQVTISLPDGTARTLSADDQLTTPDFLPQGSIRVGDLFPER